MTFLLDTDSCLQLIRKRPPKLLERLQHCRISEVGISSITLSELEYGAAKSARAAQNRIALLAFLAPLEVLSYDDHAALCYGQIRADLERRGRPIGSLNLLIAAHALSLGCTLVTGNVREFGRVRALRIENWLR